MLNLSLFGKIFQWLFLDPLLFQWCSPKTHQAGYRSPYRNPRSKDRRDLQAIVARWQQKNPDMKGLADENATDQRLTLKIFHQPQRKLQRTDGKCKALQYYPVLMRSGVCTQCGTSGQAQRAVPPVIRSWHYRNFKLSGFSGQAQRTAPPVFRSGTTTISLHAI